MVLADEQRDMLKQASRSAIRESILGLIKYWKAGSWLSCDNKYWENIVEQIKDDDLNNSFEHKHLSEYVAASAITHCFDSWSYLGRALDAEMAGDPDAARHLGYYAELRAAMSILASEGIGVFKNIHIIVKETRECFPLRSGTTHQFVWESLQSWADSAAGVDTVLQAIRPNGLPLQEWLNQISAGSKSIPHKWLSQWGLDLSRLAADRETRNLASYHPTAFTSPGPRPIRDTMISVSQLWKMCEPGDRGGFPVLDKHLLRRSLELILENIHESNQEKVINRMLEGLPLSDLARTQWTKFLCETQSNRSQTILDDAKLKDDSSHPDHSKQVLARATLLLRIATGSSANLLAEAESTIKTDLEFWWSSASVKRRLWPKDPPSSFADLWSDVDEALESIDQWLENREESACHHSLWNKNSLETSTLATTERAFLWGIGL